MEQVLDEGLEVVSEVRIWAAADSDRGEAPIVAALLQGPYRRLVRQVKVRVEPSKLLRPYILSFPPYRPVLDEALILQLWVSNERSSQVIFGATAPRADVSGPSINRNPDDQGPLAYELIWRGQGWRAALAGSTLDLVRLVAGIATATLAVTSRPSLARRLGKAKKRAQVAVRSVACQLASTLSLARRLRFPKRPDAKPPSRLETIYIFPWLIPAFAIMHYLSNNIILLRAHEALVPSAFILAVVTVVFIVLRLVFKNSASASVVTGFTGIVIFSYGHIYSPDWPQPDTRLLLGLAVPISLGMGILLGKAEIFCKKLVRPLNYTAVILLVFPLYQLSAASLANAVQDKDHDIILSDTQDIDSYLSKHIGPAATVPPHDIYYIILDGYPRSGSPPSFDNSEFVEDLEARGFLVDPHARSNYTCTVWSIASSLNMSYISDSNTCDESLVNRYRIYNAALDHALGRILTGLGYEYVHVSSGWQMTTTNRNAHQVVEFTPQGLVMSEYTDYDPVSQYRYEWERTFSLSNRFISEFAKTTLIKAFLSLDSFESDDRYAYGFTSPQRALDWLDYIKTTSSIESPKFVFAHLGKPHDPYFFDQHGNIAHGAGWSDDHDPEVASAFQGQVIWLNDRMLETVDAILASHEREPIIVITSDHGREDCSYLAMCHDILAAYFFPGGGDKIIYPSITSVNVFRSILRHYFGIELDRLEDEIFVSAG